MQRVTLAVRFELLDASAKSQVWMNMLTRVIGDAEGPDLRVQVEVLARGPPGERDLVHRDEVQGPGHGQEEREGQEPH